MTEVDGMMKKMKKKNYISNGMVTTRGAVVVGEGCVLDERHKITTQLVFPIVWEVPRPGPTPRRLLMLPIP